MKKRYLIIVLFVAVLIYISLFYGNKFYLGSFASMNNDDVKYIRSGIYLLKKGSLIYRSKNFNTVYIMPGLPLVLAVFFSFLPVVKGVLAFRIFQDVLQGFSSYLIYLIAKEVFDEKVAILALVINILYLPEYFASQVVLTECVFKFLFLLSLYFAIKGIKSNDFKSFLISGLFWSLSLYFKPVVALFPLIIILIWIKTKADVKFALRVSSLVAAIFIVIMMPWWTRNYILYKRFIPFTLSSGNPMLQATYINYDNSIDYIVYEAGENEIENNELEIFLTKKRFTTQLNKFGWKYVYWYLIKKTTYLFTRPFYWREVFGVRLRNVGIVHNFIVLTGILGMIFARKNYLSDFLMYIIIYFILIYVPYFTFSRYGYPLMSILIIFSAFLLQKIFFFDISRNLK